MKYKGFYLNDKKDGKWQQWDESGNIEIDGTYYNDIKWTGNFKDGMYYKGKMASKIEEYYDNGALKAAVSYTHLTLPTIYSV